VHGSTFRASLLLGALLAAGPASAGLRSPQVAVKGTVLASFFASQNQTIDVNAAQLDLQTMSADYSTSIPVWSFVDHTATIGFFNAVASLPPLYPVYPGAATEGWFSVASFRASPDRLVVNLFDGIGSLMGSTTYMGADHEAFSIYVSSTAETFYQQDGRNPAGLPRVLVYDGTGPRLGALWFACETGPGPGGDYADVIFLVQLVPSPVPVERSAWGELKRRFR